mgnify:CR=1 FL=1
MNKILVSIVFAVILVLGINKITDIVFHNPAPQTSAYQVNVANVASEENQTSSENSQTGDIMTLLASTNAPMEQKFLKNVLHVTALFKEVLIKSVLLYGVSLEGRLVLFQIINIRKQW